MWDWVTAAAELQRQGTCFAIVTVIQGDGSTPREAGAKMLVTEDGLHQGSVGGGRLEEEALVRAKECLAERKGKVLKVGLDRESGQGCGGEATLLIELIGSGPRLVIFGGGHVGQAVAALAVQTPFSVCLVDARKEWRGKAPAGVATAADPDQLIAGTSWGDNHFVVIMTHSHEEDFRILEQLVGNDLRYLGVIGSKAKWSGFERQLRRDGVAEERIAAIHCPIGLKIGGKSPVEVAISLMAELLGVYYGHQG